MPSISAEPLRYVALAVLGLSALGCVAFVLSGRVRVWWSGRVYPGSVAHRRAVASVEDGSAPNLAAWRAMSTERLAAYDAAVLDAQDAAQAAAERAEGNAARWNSLYRP